MKQRLSYAMSVAILASSCMPTQVYSQQFIEAFDAMQQSEQGQTPIGTRLQSEINEAVKLFRGNLIGTTEYRDVWEHGEFGPMSIYETDDEGWMIKIHPDSDAHHMRVDYTIPMPKGSVLNAVASKPDNLKVKMSFEPGGEVSEYPQAKLVKRQVSGGSTTLSKYESGHSDFPVWFQWKDARTWVHTLDSNTSAVVATFNSDCTAIKGQISAKFREAVFQFEDTNYPNIKDIRIHNIVSDTAYASADSWVGEVGVGDHITYRIYFDEPVRIQNGQSDPGLKVTLGRHQATYDTMGRDERGYYMQYDYVVPVTDPETNNGDEANGVEAVVQWGNTSGTNVIDMAGNPLNQPGHTEGKRVYRQLTIDTKYPVLESMKVDERNLYAVQKASDTFIVELNYDEPMTLIDPYTIQLQYVLRKEGFEDVIGETLVDPIIKNDQKTVQFVVEIPEGYDGWTMDLYADKTLAIGGKWNVQSMLINPQNVQDFASNTGTPYQWVLEQEIGTNLIGSLVITIDDTLPVVTVEHVEGSVPSEPRTSHDLYFLTDEALSKEGIAEEVVIYELVDDKGYVHDESVLPKEALANRGEEPLDDSHETVTVSEGIDGKYFVKTTAVDLAGNKSIAYLPEGGMLLDRKKPVVGVSKNIRSQGDKRKRCDVTFEVEELSDYTVYYQWSEDVPDPDAWQQMHRGDALTTAKTVNVGDAYEGYVYYYAEDALGHRTEVETLPVVISNNDPEAVIVLPDVVSGETDYPITFTDIKEGTKIRYKWENGASMQPTWQFYDGSSVGSSHQEGMEQLDGKATLNYQYVYADSSETSPLYQQVFIFDNSAPEIRVKATDLMTPKAQHNVYLTVDELARVASANYRLVPQDATAETLTGTIAVGDGVLKSKKVEFTTPVSGHYTLEIDVTDTNGYHASYTHKDVLVFRQEAPNLALETPLVEDAQGRMAVLQGAEKEPILFSVTDKVAGNIFFKVGKDGEMFSEDWLPTGKTMADGTIDLSDYLPREQGFHTYEVVVAAQSEGEQEMGITSEVLEVPLNIDRIPPRVEVKYENKQPTATQATAMLYIDDNEKQALSDYEITANFTDYKLTEVIDGYLLEVFDNTPDNASLEIKDIRANSVTVPIVIDWIVKDAPKISEVSVDQTTWPQEQATFDITFETQAIDNKVDARWALVPIESMEDTVYPTITEANYSRFERHLEAGEIEVETLADNKMRILLKDIKGTYALAVTMMDTAGNTHETYVSQSPASEGLGKLELILDNKTILVESQVTPEEASFRKNATLVFNEPVVVIPESIMLPSDSAEKEALCQAYAKESDAYSLTHHYLLSKASTGEIIVVDQKGNVSTQKIDVDDLIFAKEDPVTVQFRQDGNMLDYDTWAAVGGDETIEVTIVGNDSVLPAPQPRTLIPGTSLLPDNEAHLPTTTPEAILVSYDDATKVNTSKSIPVPASALPDLMPDADRHKKWYYQLVLDLDEEAVSNGKLATTVTLYHPKLHYKHAYPIQRDWMDATPMQVELASSWNKGLEHGFRFVTDEAVVLSATLEDAQSGIAQAVVKVFDGDNCIEETVLFEHTDEEMVEKQQQLTYTLEQSGRVELTVTNTAGITTVHDMGTYLIESSQPVQGIDYDVVYEYYDWRNGNEWRAFEPMTLAQKQALDFDQVRAKIVYESDYTSILPDSKREMRLLNSDAYHYFKDASTHTFQLVDHLEQVVEVPVAYEEPDLGTAPVITILSQTPETLTNNDVVVIFEVQDAEEDVDTSALQVQRLDGQPIAELKALGNNRYRAVIHANGYYEIRVKDKKHNETKLTFEVDVIDKTIDNLQPFYSIDEKTTQNVVGRFVANEAIKVTNHRGINGTDPDTFTVLPDGSVVFRENGKVMCDITDAAGNRMYEVLSVDWIDREPPEVIARVDGEAGDAYATIGFDVAPGEGEVYLVTGDIMPKLTQEELADIMAGKELEDKLIDARKILFQVKDNGSYTFTLQDEAGNLVETTAVIEFLDRTAPVIEKVEWSYTYRTAEDATYKEQTGSVIVEDADKVTINTSKNPATNQDVSVEITANEDVKIVGGEDNYITTHSKVFSQDASYQFQVADKGNNIAEVEVEVELIDKNRPILHFENPAKMLFVEGDTNPESAYNRELIDDYTVKKENASGELEEVNLKVQVDYGTLNPDEPMPGEYTITYFVVDAVGNETKATREITVLGEHDKVLTVNNTLPNVRQEIVSTTKDTILEVKNYDEKLYVSYAKGQHTAAQMKAIGTNIQTETGKFTLHLPNEGWWTVVAQTAERDRFMAYIYVK